MAQHWVSVYRCSAVMVHARALHAANRARNPGSRQTPPIPSQNISLSTGKGTVRTVLSIEWQDWRLHALSAELTAPCAASTAKAPHRQSHPMDTNHNHLCEHANHGRASSIFAAIALEVSSAVRIGR